MSDDRIELIKSAIRDVPDFPKPGIVFKDITPVLRQGQLLDHVVDLMAESIAKHEPTVIVGIESRGFLFGTPLATKLGIGFVPVRKPGKLPHRTLSHTYTLEYGEDTLEIHEDALHANDRVVIVDDLLATGGTLNAACQLVSKLGANVSACRLLIELSFLQGRKNLPETDLHSLITY